MVKILQPTQYDADVSDELRAHFSAFEYDLSPFQKHAIDGITSGHHTLSCVPTGSGKTLPALFAIDYFTKRGMRVIYTSPIKALSNQKYHEFSQKFPDVSVGLLTGDVKVNPGADVLIMTAEILQNALARADTNTQHDTPNIQSAFTSVSNKSVDPVFNLVIDETIGCVIQDEVHYINDASRGHVWENTIMMLPPYIQMVMLSATLDSPERFASWIEDVACSSPDVAQKEVYLATSSHRPVPLTHYSFICSPQALFKSVKDKSAQARARATLNKLHTLKTQTGAFDEAALHRVNETLQLMKTHRVFAKRSFVLNEVCNHMVENDMLPAVCFVLSKKQIAQACHEVSVPLQGYDDAVPAVIERECAALLRSKLPNVDEYLRMPEYHEMVALMTKGVAIHHSGVLPVIREVVEIMFDRGYVKLLFATETFAVGLNLPIKTALFTDLRKFDGTGMRMLFPHEYTQAAGRAGRRGKDAVGNVIHLTNLFRDISPTEHRIALGGAPQMLTSKFRISYSLVLDMILNETKAETFCERSMLQREIAGQTRAIADELIGERERLDVAKTALAQTLRTDRADVDRYMVLVTEIPQAKNKARKKLEREAADLKDGQRHLLTDVAKVQSVDEKRRRVRVLEEDMRTSTEWFGSQVATVRYKLVRDGFATIDASENSVKYAVTHKGHIASIVREAPCMVFACMMTSPVFTDHLLCAADLAALLSCFAGLRVSDDMSCNGVIPEDTPLSVRDALRTAKTVADDISDFNAAEGVFASDEGDALITDMIPFVYEWFAAADEPACKVVLQRVGHEKGVLVGDFVKMLLKIANIASEVERVCEMVGDLTLVATVREATKGILKHVATTQSLYV